MTKEGHKIPIFSRFTGLPECIGQLYGLRDLNISKLRLIRLPDTFEWLYNLQSLDVSSNNLGVRIRAY